MAADERRAKKVTMKVHLIRLPYDSGQRDRRMGRGPRRILDQGLVERLQGAGFDVESVTVETDAPFATEVGTTFELYGKLSEQLSRPARAGAFPLVLAGNCGSTLGAAAGLGMAELGVIWFDANGDFNTPETSESGFLDGMGLAVLTGRCWQAMAARIPGFSPLPDEHAALVGARDFDAAELRALEASGILRVAPESLTERGGRAAMAETVSALGPPIERVYLHLDLDVHDRDEACANQFAAPGGPPAAEVREAVGLIAERLPLAGAGLASYDPDCDPEGRVAELAVQAVARLLSGVRERTS